MIHQINILIHVSAGCLGLLLGIIILIAKKGTRFHRQAGNLFMYTMGVVVSTAFFGWLFFRSNPFLLMLTLLAGYNTFSGFRTIKLRERKSGLPDIFIAVITLFTGVFYTIWLMGSDATWSASVIYPTISGLVLVTVYDLAKRFVFFTRWKHLWLYEHIYKIISGFGALLSAFTGTVLPDWTKPYSQALPGVFCLLLIVSFIIFESRRKRRIVPQPLTS